MHGGCEGEREGGKEVIARRKERERVRLTTRRRGRK